VRTFFIATTAERDDQFAVFVRHKEAQTAAEVGWGVLLIDGDFFRALVGTDFAAAGNGVGCVGGAVTARHPVRENLVNVARLQIGNCPDNRRIVLRSGSFSFAAVAVITFFTIIVVIPCGSAFVLRIVRIKVNGMLVISTCDIIVDD